jgi:hypothetical protein
LGEAIKMESFRDLYDPEIIEKDLAYVQEMERRFAEADTPDTEERRRLAVVFEAIFHEQAELSEWLGPEAYTRKTSPYDDYKNGVDAVVEFIQEQGGISHLALAIDVTYSRDTSKKLHRIKSEIERGQLAQVKYYVSDEIGFRGELVRIPRVIVGVDAETIRQLSELWLERDQTYLAEHYIQFQILEEIQMQLVAYKQYAEKIKQHDLIATLNRTLDIVNGIIEEKGDMPREKYMNDKVYLQLKANLETLFA